MIWTKLFFNRSETMKEELKHIDVSKYTITENGNVIRSANMKHVQLKYGSREDINHFLSTIPSENFIYITKEKENRYLLVYIEDEK